MERVRTAPAPVAESAEPAGGGRVIPFWSWALAGGAVAAAALAMIQFHEPPATGSLEVAADGAPAPAVTAPADDAGPRLPREKPELETLGRASFEESEEELPAPGGRATARREQPRGAADDPVAPASEAADAKETVDEEDGMPSPSPSAPKPAPEETAWKKDGRDDDGGDGAADKRTGERKFAGEADRLDEAARPAPTAGGPAAPPAGEPAPAAKPEADAGPTRFALVYLVDDLEQGRRSVEAALRVRPGLYTSRVWIDPSVKPEAGAAEGFASRAGVDAALPTGANIDQVRAVLAELGHEGAATVAHLRVPAAKLKDLRTALEGQPILRETIVRRLYETPPTAGVTAGGGPGAVAGSEPDAPGAADADGPDRELLERLRREAEARRSRDAGEPSPPPRPDGAALDRMRQAPPPRPEDTVSVDEGVTEVEVEVILLRDPRAAGAKDGR